MDLDGNISIRVDSFSFPPHVLDFSSLKRLREKVMGSLRGKGFLILNERLVDEEEVKQVSSFLGIKKCSAVVEVYREEGGFIYREYLVVNPRHLVSKGWFKVLVIYLVERRGGVFKGVRAGRKLKVALILSFPELRDVEFMCVTYSKSIYRDVVSFIDGSGFNSRLEYERVVRPGEFLERVIEVGVNGYDIWVRFMKLNRTNEFGLELRRSS